MWSQVYFVLGLILSPKIFQRYCSKTYIDLILQEIGLGHLLVTNCISLSWVVDTLRYILQSLVILDHKLSSCSGETEGDLILVSADILELTW